MAHRRSRSSLATPPTTTPSICPGSRRWSSERYNHPLTLSACHPVSSSSCSTQIILHRGAMQTDNSRGRFEEILATHQPAIVDLAHRLRTLFEELCPDAV